MSSIHDTSDDFDERRTMVAPTRRTATRPPPTPPATPGRRPVARTARGTEPPDAARTAQRLPAFMPADTVMPVVQYRGAPAAETGPTRAAPPPTPAEGAAAALRAYAARRAPVTVPPIESPMPAPDLTRAVATPGAARRPTPPPPRRLPPPRGSQALPGAVPAPPPVRHPELRPVLGRRGQVVVVFGCRGGAGATTLAVNTAAELARSGRTVCVADFDLELGDVFVALDLEPQTSLAALATEAADLDGAAVRRRMVHHRSGLYATTQVGHPDEVGTAGMARRAPVLLHALAAQFDDVIVDGVRDFDDLSLAALSAADQVLLVITQDVLSVRRAARAIARLRQLGLADDRLRLVVNRSRGGAEIDDAAIERALGLRVAAAVRDDARVTTALDDGALLSDLPRARGVAGDVAELAGLVGRIPTAAPRRPRGLLGRLLGGGS
jgi:MinD-like ATPase involved in chromosome partitioning or flagellar assembly